MSQKKSSNQMPASTYPGWHFGDLPVEALIPVLQRYLLDKYPHAQWQPIWLNNDGRPVIGLLPKVNWVVYADDRGFAAPATGDKQTSTYHISKSCRNNDLNASATTTTVRMSYDAWLQALIDYSLSFEQPSNATNQRDDTPSYCHGLMGFIGYDIAAHELGATFTTELMTQPCAVLGHYDIYLTLSFDQKRPIWQLNIIKDNQAQTDSDEALFAKLKNSLDALDAHLSLGNFFSPQAVWTPLSLNPLWQKNDYQNAFAKTQYYLQQGDGYQINLTQVWRGFMANRQSEHSLSSGLVNYLPALHQNTQAPFAGYLSVSTSPKHSALDFELLSCSPELFFTFTTDNDAHTRRICTKPIKGTAPRGLSPEQDLVSKQTLMKSEKDRAENVMIVDLLRNDLGKYAKVGSVKVPHLFTIESFSHVHHMVSTITAELRETTHPLQVLFGSLPAGSITGTPKKRAVEIIAELEVRPRGAYCGTMGYMNFDGSGQWNVLIRTLQATPTAHQERMVSLWAGGGITVASDGDAEYQECFDKVGNLLAVLAQKD